MLLNVIKMLLNVIIFISIINALIRLKEWPVALPSLRRGFSGAAGGPIQVEARCQRGAG